MYGGGWDPDSANPQSEGTQILPTLEGESGTQILQANI